MTQKNREPIAVLISDIHFTPATLEEAAASFLRAQFRAKMLDVPLIVSGDTLDSKAIMRAECVNRLIHLVSVKDAPDTIFLVGNHDKVNEKSKDHSLNFLKPYATVIETPQEGKLGHTLVLLVPYMHDLSALKPLLKPDLDNPLPSIIIMHQGIIGSEAGHYMQDHAALTQEDLSGLRVISGHYHRRQTIELPDGGKFDYVGNPYTLGFGEANDPAKGYQILNSDGSMEFVPIDLRTHVIYEMEVEKGISELDIRHTDKDIILVRIRGSKEQLSKVDKKAISQMISISQPFRLDLIATDTGPIKVEASKNLSDAELLDSIIDSTSYEKDYKAELKQLWRRI